MAGCSAVKRKTTLWLEFWSPKAFKIGFSRPENIEDVWANSYWDAIRHCKTGRILNFLHFLSFLVLENCDEKGKGPEQRKKS